MGFSFYPKHEHKCPHVSHCPHLGGAALGTLVLLANGEEQSRRALHATIDAERARNERLVAENERLQRELDTGFTATQGTFTFSLTPHAVARCPAMCWASIPSTNVDDGLHA